MLPTFWSPNHHAVWVFFALTYDRACYVLYDLECSLTGIRCFNVGNVKQGKKVFLAIFFSFYQLWEFCDATFHMCRYYQAFVTAFLNAEGTMKSDRRTCSSVLLPHWRHVLAFVYYYVWLVSFWSLRRWSWKPVTVVLTVGKTPVFLTFFMNNFKRVIVHMYE